MGNRIGMSQGRFWLAISALRTQSTARWKFYPIFLLEDPTTLRFPAVEEFLHQSDAPYSSEVIPPARTPGGFGVAVLRLISSFELFSFQFFSLYPIAPHAHHPWKAIC